MKPSDFLTEQTGKERIQARFAKLSGGETLSDREKYWANEVEKLKKELAKYQKPEDDKKTDESQIYSGGGMQTGLRKYKPKPAGLNEDSIDVIKLDVPLFIRLLEYAREDAQTDMDLHDVTTRVIKLASKGKVLNMDDYDALMDTLKKESSVMKGLQNENKGLPFPGSYEQEYGMVKSKGPRRITAMTNEEQIDEKWSEKYKRSIDCSNPKGFSQKAHCQGRNKK